jgi:ABC-type amino acid transport system permease subunit
MHMAIPLMNCTSEHVHDDMSFAMTLFCNVMYFVMTCILQLVQSRVNRSFQSSSSLL